MNQLLEDLIDGTLGWLANHLGDFSLPTREEDEQAGEIGIGRRRKAFGELALAVYLTSRYESVRRRPEYRRILRHVEEAVEEPYFAFDMPRRLGLFPLYLMVWMALAAAGRPPSGWRWRLERMVAGGLLETMERTPWNHIDMRYYLDAAGLEHRMAGESELFALSSVARPPSIAQLRSIDVYALTHILFHLSDFGRRSLVPVVGEEHAALSHRVETLMGIHIHRDDPDLVAELLLSCRCLRHYPEPFADLGWRHLVRSQRPDGDIRNRDFEETMTTESETHFRRNYHPTLVTLLAAAVERYEEACR